MCDRGPVTIDIWLTYQLALVKLETSRCFPSNLLLLLMLPRDRSAALLQLAVQSDSGAIFDATPHFGERVPHLDEEEKQPPSRCSLSRLTIGCSMDDGNHPGRVGQDRAQLLRQMQSPSCKL